MAASQSACLFLDEHARVAKFFHRLPDGDWAYETVQDLQPIFDANKEAQNHCSPWSASREIKLVARIPTIFAMKWQQEDGLDVFSPDPDVQRKIDDRLNSSEFQWMRTDNSVL
jgi:hypothetical protein